MMTPLYYNMEDLCSYLSKFPYLNEVSITFVNGLQIDLPQLLDNCKSLKRIRIKGLCRFSTAATITTNDDDSRDRKHKIEKLVLEYKQIDTNTLFYIAQNLDIRKHLCIWPPGINHYQDYSRRKIVSSQVQFNALHLKLLRTTTAAKNLTQTMLISNCITTTVVWICAIGIDMRRALKIF